jgi:hypothetical protein
MKKIAKALCICALYAPLTLAQFVAGGDSVYTVPARPTVKDPITYNFYDVSSCCCAEFVNPTVMVQDTIVYLSFSVNTDPCQLCRCLVPGAWNAFKGGTLKAGKYAIYRMETFYCPPGRVCPAIIMLPVRIGQVTVMGTTGAIVASAVAMPASGLTFAQEKSTVHLGYTLAQQGQLRVKVFDARGILAGVLYNGQASAGTHRFSWTAAAQGIYFLSVEINGIAVSTQKIIVSR